jgi:hypothetical protein
LAVTGAIRAVKGVETTVIRPVTDDLTVDLSPASPSGSLKDGFGTLNIRGEGDQVVASVNAQGEGTFNKIRIAENAADSTVGKATLPAGQSEIVLSTTQLTSTSYIYITPLSSTNNQVLYVKGSTPPADGNPGSFTVGTDAPAQSDIRFNWWIIN